MYYGFQYGKRYLFWSGILSLLTIIVNIIYFFIFNKRLKNEYIIGIFCVNLFTICRVIVIGIKWGYQPPAIFEVMRKQVLTQEQVNFINLYTYACIYVCNMFF